MEIDTRENLDLITQMLTSRGYQLVVDDFVVVEASADEPGVYVYMLYAIRPDIAATQPMRVGQLQATSSAAIFSTNDLRRYLKDRLPEYMIPSSIMELAALPRTPNGKLDRKALPVPTVDRPQLASAYVAPSSTLEQAIANVWQDVLRVEQVGIHDNFFELGGTSLLIVQARTKLRDALGYDISLVDLFRYPNVKTLADYLGQSSSAQPSFDKVRARAEKQAARRQQRTAKPGGYDA
jgi:acyl carrier protein